LIWINPQQGSHPISFHGPMSGSSTDRCAVDGPLHPPVWRADWCGGFAHGGSAAIMLASMA
jgi:hypothetical protein